MIVMGREGYVAWAKAGAEKQMKNMNASAMVRRMITDVFSLAFFCCFYGAGLPASSGADQGQARRLDGCCRQNPVTPSQFRIVMIFRGLCEAGNMPGKSCRMSSCFSNG